MPTSTEPPELVTGALDGPRYERSRGGFPGSVRDATVAKEDGMGVCEVCGNEYDKAFEVVTSDGVGRVFDSFECAIHAMAPVCGHCGCRVIGHGVEGRGKIFCCAHCAAEAGVGGLRDRL